MKYRRLPFEEYFINTSEDYTHTGRVTYPVKYIAVKYNTTKMGKRLGLAHEVNYEIHYEPDRDVIQIHFQRTFGMIDWIANVFEFGSRYYRAIEFQGEPLQLRVHHGWGNMYLAIKQEVREKWSALHQEHPDAATEILGWSLGSAIACLCCQDLNYNFGVKPYLHLRQRAPVQMHPSEPEADAAVSFDPVYGLRELCRRERYHLLYASVPRVHHDPSRQGGHGAKALLLPADPSPALPRALRSAGAV